MEALARVTFGILKCAPKNMEVRFVRLGGRMPLVTNGSISMTVLRCSKRVTKVGLRVESTPNELAILAGRPYRDIHNLMLSGDVLTSNTSRRFEESAT